MPKTTTPKRAGIWESFDNAGLDPNGRSPRRATGGTDARGRIRWLLALVGLGGGLLLLDLAGLFSTADDVASRTVGSVQLLRVLGFAIPFVAYAVAVHRRRDSQLEVAREDHAVRFALFILIAIYAVSLLGVYAPAPTPSLLRSPFFLPFVASLVLYIAAQTYADASRAVTFYGRFIRPGLKRLLQVRGPQMLGDEKLFRGRKTVILKLDMANYTRTTFDMPYGMRRLFQDLWFTLVDKVVARQVFLDKNLGDGSVYCFEDGLPGGSCSAALRAALEIRERQLGTFDRLYRQRLEVLLERTPELGKIAPRYYERYRAKTGQDFSERRTQIRIALTTGYVDEGLWGLASQSHYDVQGGPVVVATRLEEAAENGEIVFDDDFLAELEEESPDWLDRSLLEPRQVDLKGIGAWKLYALPDGVGAELLGQA